MDAEDLSDPVSSNSPPRGRDTRDASAKWERAGRILGAKPWAGIGVIIAFLVGVATIALAVVALAIQLAVFLVDRTASVDASGGQPVPSESAASAATDQCLVYTGSDQVLNAHVDYPEEAFSRVPCTQPHQYEIVPRDEDVPCSQAIWSLTGITSGKSVGFNRYSEANYGPYSCALGRMEGLELVTDTYRISTTQDPLGVFGSCIDSAEIDAFLAGESVSYHQACNSGMALPAAWSNSQKEDPQKSCESRAEGLRFHSVLSTAYEVEEGPVTTPWIRCIYILG